MRVWEVEDNKLLASDLVREQDFILRLRRIQRLGTPHLVFNFVLNALEVVVKNRRALEAMHEKLSEFAKVTHGSYAEMSNGDIFIVWESAAANKIVADPILAALLPEGSALQDKEKVLLSYRLPEDYVALRERTNHYIELVRLATVSTANSPSETLKSITTRGPLSAWSLDQISRLLEEIDLRRYGRSQTIYSHGAPQHWTPILEEFYISFEDLRRECFPKIDILTHDHLFLALCEQLDQRLLALLADQPATILGRRLHLNLSVTTVMGSIFAQFARAVPPPQHSLIGFEINCGDLLQDFSQTLNAIDVIRREGFKVALDHVTPNMLGYLNVTPFNTDFIKINVSKDHADLMSSPTVRDQLKELPTEKIVFYHCDNEKSLTFGLERGVKYFQGWLIDDQASNKA